MEPGVLAGIALELAAEIANMTHDKGRLSADLLSPGRGCKIRCEPGGHAKCCRQPLRATLVGEIEMEPAPGPGAPFSVVVIARGQRLCCFSMSKLIGAY